MKSKNTLRALLFAMLMTPCLAFGQMITVTTAHWNFGDTTLNPESWMEIEKEYHEKVVMKNEFIAASNVLYHSYTSDNSEVMFVYAYRNWSDIEKAAERNGELAKEAWPDDEKRKAFFKRQSQYYTTSHSDEIYWSLPNGKGMEASDSSLTYYVRKKRIARMPEGGSGDEIRALSKEFAENTIHKNEYILAYYPYRHMWGADSRDFIEVFVFKSMADMDAGLKKQGELVEAYWPDKDKRKAFFKKFNSYMEPGWHGDELYVHEPKLAKQWVDMPEEEMEADDMKSKKKKKK